MPDDEHDIIEPVPEPPIEEPLIMEEEIDDETVEPPVEEQGGVSPQETYERFKRAKEYYQKARDWFQKKQTEKQLARQGLAKGGQAAERKLAEQAAVQAGKQAAKQGAKQAGKAAAKVAVEAAAAPETAGLSIVIVEAADKVITYIAKHKKLFRNILIGLMILGLLPLFVVIGLLALGFFGIGGRTAYAPAGAEHPSTKALVQASNTSAGLTGLDAALKKLNFPNEQDKKFVADGKLDVKLAGALEYITNKHKFLEVSHIVSAYADMPDAPKITQEAINVDIHKTGQAVDITKIDFLYKSVEEKEMCKETVSLLCGPYFKVCRKLADEIHLGDLIFYSDSEDNVSAITTPISYDAAAAKVEAQRAELEQAENKVEEAEKELDELMQKLDQTRAKLAEMRNRQEISEEQRQKLDRIIANLDTFANQAKNIVVQIKKFNADLKAFNQTLKDLQDALISLKQALDVAMLNPDASPSQRDTINKVNIQVSKIIVQLDSICTAVKSASNYIYSVSEDILLRIAQIADSANKSASDLNANLDELDQTLQDNNASLDPEKMESIAKSLVDMENFEKTIKDLAEMVAQIAIDAVIDQIEDEVEKAIEENLNKALGELGLGMFGDDSLLRLPCVGFVPPNGGTAGDAGVTDPNNLNLNGTIRVGPTSFPIMDLIKKIIPEELLVYAVFPNTTWKGNDFSQAVPIKVKWQDPKPEGENISETDDKDLQFMNPLIYYTVYQPESRRKVHQLIGELLQYPQDTNINNRVTQIIAYSKERDVDPFSEILNQIYGISRPLNFGLFDMPQAWDHLHIGY